MKVASLLAATLCALLLAGCKAAPHDGSSGSQMADVPNPAQYASAHSASGFDYYLLNLSWSPEFCYSHPQAAECAQHLGFVLHGLWPQNTDGTYPEHCSDAPGPSNPSAFRDLYPDEGLLRHEWQAHGTCSGLRADAFFSAARHAVHSVEVPGELSTLHTQTSL
ncbi:MAG TPA: hypothetical protein VFU68_04540, partial [Terracidiphilus sp.]|nr:hypothetical protein [Terracidiphilus sp.]